MSEIVLNLCYNNQHAQLVLDQREINGRTVTVCTISTGQQPLGRFIWGAAIQNPVDTNTHKGFMLAAGRAMDDPKAPGYFQRTLTRLAVYRALLVDRLGDRAPIQRAIEWGVTVINASDHIWNVVIHENERTEKDERTGTTHFNCWTQRIGEEQQLGEPGREHNGSD
jgi:hypothetical protein